jgi:hypothetical protein
MRKLLLSLIFLQAAAGVYAQSGAITSSPGTSAAAGFFSQWMARTSATQARQPSWAVPLVTTFTGLIQVARTDFVRQVAPALSPHFSQAVISRRFGAAEEALPVFLGMMGWSVIEVSGRPSPV